MKTKGCLLNWFNSGEEDAFKSNSESDSGTHISIFNCTAKEKKKKKERNRGEKSIKKVNKGKRKEMKMIKAERLGGKRREKRRK